MRVATRADDSDKHSLDVNQMLFIKGKLYTAADDGKIKAWEPDLKKAADVQAHTCSVFSIAPGPTGLYSCSNDGTIKSWEYNVLTPKATIVEDKDCEIWRIYYDNGFLFAAYNTGNLNVYKDEKLYGQVGIAEPVKDMAVKNQFLFTVKDLDLVVTELKLQGEHLQYGNLHNFEGRSPVTLVGSKYVAFGGRSGKDINIHESSHDNHFKRVSEVKGASEMIINAIAGADWDGKPVLFSGGWDKILRKWKIEGDQVKQEDSVNVDFVINSIAMGEKGSLYVAGGDGHIVRVDI